ncbi:unnamed protein product [Durusdinium trenchii]|uniref:Uncharacterized protein n=1 Tax=Durusdinium trenchii TaxID=1381693 RepID=A0ABP0NJ95_9DINO
MSEILLEISGLDGQAWWLKVNSNLLGSELEEMIAERLVQKVGSKFTVLWKGEALFPSTTLREQGLADRSRLSYIYVQVSMWHVWQVLFGTDPERTSSLHEVRHLHLGRGIPTWSHLHLPLLKNLQHLKLEAEFNDSLAGLGLPASLRSLTFGYRYNQPLKGVTFPALKALNFGGCFNQPLENLPASLEELTFGRCFDQPLSNLPKELRTLRLGELFRSSVKDVMLPNLQDWSFRRYIVDPLSEIHLPQTLRHLTLPDFFNQSLQEVEFPTHLESLLFGYSFNQPLAKVKLPRGLRRLSFGAFFNTSLEGVEFPDLQSMTFGYYFDQSLEKVQLPSTLQSLVLGLDYNQSLENVNFPTSLELLTFGNFYRQSLKNVHFPPNLQSMTFGRFFQDCTTGADLPKTLRTLNLIHTFNCSLEVVKLPPTLENLSFGNSFNQSLEGLSCGKLRSLSLGDHFNQSLTTVHLPGTLESLSFGAAFNQPLDISLPRSLQHLAFGSSFNQPLDGIDLPDLRSLRLGYFFRQSLVKISLPRLERLEMLGCAETPTKAEVCPSLTHLTLGHGSFSQINLSSSLTHLSINSLPKEADLEILAEQPCGLRTLKCQDLLVSFESDKKTDCESSVGDRMACALETACLEDLTPEQLNHLNRTYWETYIAKYPVVGRLEDPPYRAADYDRFAGPFAQVQYTRPRREGKPPRESRCPVTRAARELGNALVKLLPRQLLSG